MRNQRTLTSFPNGPMAVFVLALLVDTAVSWAATASVEIRNVSDNAEVSSMDFGNFLQNSGGGWAPQYLRVSYAAGPEMILFFGRNFDWEGEGNERNGLLDAAKKTRIPLYWAAFDSVQNTATLSTTSLTQLRDIGDANWASYRDQASVSKYAGNVTYIYLFSGNVLQPEGSYSTRLAVRSLDSFFSNQVAKVSHAPFEKIAILSRPIQFLATVDGAGGNMSAVLYYRFNGGDWNPEPFTIGPNGTLSVSIPVSGIKTGTLEYFMEVSDGLNITRFQSAQEPVKVEINQKLTYSVDRRGGVVKIGDGNPSNVDACLTIPSGTIPAPQTFTAEDLSNIPLSGFGSQPPLGAVSFSAGRRLIFRQPSTLVLPYLDDDNNGTVDGTGLQEKDLRIYWLDGSAWRLVGGTVNASQNTVSVPVLHLSTFALFVTPAQTLYKPKESIITPGKQDGVNDVAIFDGLTSNFKIEIFDVRGARIQTLNNINVWDGRDSHGRLVESGAYLYQIHVDGQNFSGVITVAK